MCHFLQDVRGGQKFVSQLESSKYRMKRFKSNILIRFQIKTSFRTSVCGWKLDLPDIQWQVR